MDAFLTNKHQQTNQQTKAKEVATETKQFPQNRNAAVEMLFCENLRPSRVQPQTQFIQNS